MLSEIQKSKTSKIIDGKVICKEVFTAYDITKALRLSEDCFHGDVRDYTSQLMQEYINLDEYKMYNDINTPIQYIPIDYIDFNNIGNIDNFDFDLNINDITAIKHSNTSHTIKFFIKSRGRFNIPLRFLNSQRLYGLKNKRWTLYFDEEDRLLISDSNNSLGFLPYNVKKHKSYKLEKNNLLRFPLKAISKDIYALEFIGSSCHTVNTLNDVNIFIFKILKHKHE